MAAKPLIFISCGQYSDDEISLGNAVEAMVRSETPFEPYFAEQQNSLEGLTGHILAALGRSAGFIGIMHSRGDVATPGGQVRRGSVWVEQELAIAAFIQYFLKRPLEVAMYLQRSIAREGMRQQLRLKPIEFDQPSQVLGDLRTRIQCWNIGAVDTTPLRAQWKFDKTKPYRSERHDYRFEVDLKNTGTSTIEQWQVEVWFPSQFIEGADRSSRYKVFQLDDLKLDKSKARIWQGSTLPVFKIDYFVEDGTWPGWDESGKPQPVVKIRVCADTQPPWEVEIPFMDIQHF